MFKRLNKSGLSEVVTSIIVILLVLIAIGIIWAVVSNLIDTAGSQTESELDCIETNIAIESATNVSGGYNVILTRSARGADTVGSVAVFFSDGSNSVRNDTNNLGLTQLGKKTINFPHSELGVVGGNAETVRAALILPNGDLCQPTLEENVIQA